MSPTAILLIGISVIIVIVIIIYLNDGFTPVETQAPNPTTFSNQYQVPAPWYWVIGNNITSDTTIFKGESEVIATFGNDTYTFQIDTGQIISGTGPEGTLSASQLSRYVLFGSAPLQGTCPSYTFIAEGPIEGPSVKFARLPSCTALEDNENGVRGSCHPLISRENCQDADQLFGQKSVRACQGQVVYGSTTTGTDCRTQTGDFVPINSTEILYTHCTTPGTDPQSGTGGGTTLCPGTLGVLHFGNGERDRFGNIVIPYLYIEGPSYVQTGDTYTNVTPLNVNIILDISYTYKGFARQLFRIRTAVFESNRMVFNSAGPFLRIYSRGTGLCLSPRMNTSSGLPDPTKAEYGPLQLISCSTALTGYWWYLLPETIQPPPYQIDIEGNDIIGISRQQLLYVTNPSIIPASPANLWNWISTNRLSLLVARPINGVVSLDVIIISTTTSTSTASKQGQFSYTDFSLVSFLTR